jgi:IS605 OrfB family transposase
LKRRSEKKCRLMYVPRNVNPSKLKKLEELHAEYVAYLRICVEQMLSRHTLSMIPSQLQIFFPPAQKLTSHFQLSARNQAVGIISSWSKAVYKRAIREEIAKLEKAGKLTVPQAQDLATVGLCQLDRASDITQETIDKYWMLLDEYGGKKPEVRNSIHMMFVEKTARFGKSEKKTKFPFWVVISTLDWRKLVAIPLQKNPFITSELDIQHGMSLRKKNGRWRFEVVERKKDAIEAPEPVKPREPKKAKKQYNTLGIDVGLNVLAAVSNGDLYGTKFKAEFDRRYKKVKVVRANRQRQGLKENSPRLAQLESNLSGLTKTEIGNITNRLVKRHPKTTFVLEDLNLKGCKGQKRFAYKALSSSLKRKAHKVIEVNPAYTSQECPSCHYVSRRNRSGIKFRCRCCGRRVHADWVGSSNIAGRSGNKSITCKTAPSSVITTLREQFLALRTSSLRSLIRLEPLSKGPNLTPRGSS